mgnify:CR=1 FL=1
MKKNGIIIWLLNCFVWLATHQAMSQCMGNINHWESVVLDTQQWKYRVPNAAIPGWNMPGFNDSSWLSGPGGMGFGDNDDNTLIPNPSVSVYMRKEFVVFDTASVVQAVFCMDYDDGFVAYLNGVEIARANINAVTPAWNAQAASSHEAMLYQNQQPDYFVLNSTTLAGLLINGTNVLCVETHNFPANSSDLTSRPFLQLGISNGVYNYFPVPVWFVPPVALETKLPIMVINTLGQTIVDDPRIVCDMGIIYNGPGMQNCIFDPLNDYNGKISIEFRGSTSQGFPKKPYGFSTIDTSGNNLNVSLLGMPPENDWTLLNPYNDKTFMRDVLIHDLARSMGWYSSRCHYVELVINGQYQGVYVLMEKIKQDKNRVNVAKLTSSMNSGDSLTGGYVFKIDKITGNSGGGWNTSQGVSIQNHDPKWNVITPVQKQYLQNYINNFESVLWSQGANNPSNGYRSMANVFSFIDFFILNEISNNIDGYRLSTYISKDRNSQCGRFSMGPFWDFNLSFGNANYCNGYPTTGWQMYQGCGDGSSKWIDRMLQDQWFRNMMHCRWNELRQDLLSTTNILARIDTYANYLREASVRDSTRWQTIGTYVWPNAWIANSWQGEIDSMKYWLISRLNWIDGAMYGTTQACNTVANMSLAVDEINFHSESSIDAGDWLELVNFGNTTLDISHLMILDGDKYGKYCVLPAGMTLAPGARLVLYADSAKFSSVHPTVTNKYGPLCFNLSNAGQSIELRDKDNKHIQRITYADDWQCTTDGYGRSLQLVSPTLDPNLMSSWFAACVGGSPGVAFTNCSENPILSEINYASSTSADAGDWIELYNKSNIGLDLSGWLIKDKNDASVWQFPAGYTLASQSYVVLYNDAAKFNTRFPLLNNKLGPLPFGLSSSSDVVRFYNPNGLLKYSVCYSSALPWPQDANGLGKTLENAQYNGDHNDALSWFAGCPEGSPGKAYTPQCWPVSTSTVDTLSLLVYPNPCSDVLHIGCVIGLKAFRVVDLLGQTLMHGNNPGTSINITKLPVGVYTLELEMENELRFQVLIQKR